MTCEFRWIASCVRHRDVDVSPLGESRAAGVGWDIGADVDAEIAEDGEIGGTEAVQEEEGFGVGDHGAFGRTGGGFDVEEAELEGLGFVKLGEDFFLHEFAGSER